MSEDINLILLYFELWWKKVQHEYNHYGESCLWGSCVLGDAVLNASVVVMA